MGRVLTVLYVVCYQSVTRNSNNISGSVYNRELTESLHQLATPTPRQIQILNLTAWLFSQTHVSGGVIKNILVSKISVTFNLYASKVSILNYL